MAAAAAAAASRLSAKRDQPSPNAAARLLAAAHAVRLCACIAVTLDWPQQAAERLAGQLARVALSAAPVVLQDPATARICEAELVSAAQMLAYTVDVVVCRLLQHCSPERQAAAVPVDLLPAWLTAVVEALLSTARSFPHGECRQPPQLGGGRCYHGASMVLVACSRLQLGACCCWGYYGHLFWGTHA